MDWTLRKLKLVYRTSLNNDDRTDPLLVQFHPIQLITLTVVLSVLNSTKSTDILAIVEALSPVNQVSCSPRFPASGRLDRADPCNGIGYVNEVSVQSHGIIGGNKWERSPRMARKGVLDSTLSIMS